MTAVADIFDRDADGYIDYYEFVAALHPNKDAYRPTTDADKIEDEVRLLMRRTRTEASWRGGEPERTYARVLLQVTRQVAQCKCAKRFQVEQIGENKYRVGPAQLLTHT